MNTAVLVAENLSQFCPVTNHYRCSDGRYLLVTYPRLDVLGTLAGLDGIGAALEAAGVANVPMMLAHQPRNTEVFLADENANVLDGDGDLANGMTPILRCDGPLPVAEALSQAGYQLVES